MRKVLAMRKGWAAGLAFGLCCSALVVAAPRAWAAPAASFQDERDREGFSPEQLENLLAPIALYPDPLLAQVLLAATFVDQVDEAARYVRAYGQNGIDEQPWDVSVKAVAHYPVVLDMLADKIDWTASLGQAYAAQSTDVMIGIQRLRRMARSQGNLETTDEQSVYQDDDDIRIVPAQPRYIYVPRYSPAVVYYHRPTVGFGISFWDGFLIGAWLNDDFDWRGHRVYYHGWSGGGWIGLCRPHVHVTTVYVHPRYASVSFNRTIVDRHVNYVTLNRYNAIHTNVTYDNVRVHTSVRYESRPSETRAPSGNAVINRNIDTRDPQLDRYRGREEANQTRISSEARAAEAPKPTRVETPKSTKVETGAATAEASHAGPHAYGKTETKVDPIAASSRGQASREAAKAPPENKPPPPKQTTIAKTAEHAAPRQEEKKKK